jgi:predicted TIM-barrel fold metal-dependent hydrolase
MPTVGVDRFEEDRAARHMVSHTMEMMLVALNKILWATDYPHSDGFFPGAPKMLGQRIESLSPEARHQVLAGGGLGFYGLR